MATPSPSHSTAAPAPRVLVLQHIALEGPGAIAGALAAEGLALDVVRADRADPVPREPGDHAALLVMGGPMGVYEADRYPSLRQERALIERFLAADRPVLGVCLGSQLLAAALGARVFPSGGQEIGWAPVELLPGAAGDPLLGSAPRTFTPLHWHGDVFDLPAGAVPLARSARTAVQAFRHGARAWGLLFHVEAEAAQVRDMVEAFPDDLRKAGLDGRAVLAEAADRLGALTPVRAQVLGAFARAARAAAGPRE